jgi:hypothetical protein
MYRARQSLDPLLGACHDDGGPSTTLKESTMAAPERQFNLSPTEPTIAAAAIDAAIASTQEAIAAVPEGSARRILFDAAIYLDVARSMLRNEGH